MTDAERDDEQEWECGEPCPYPGCAQCSEYWVRMVHEGLWKPGVGWTRIDMNNFREVNFHANTPLD